MEDKIILFLENCDDHYHNVEIVYTEDFGLFIFVEFMYGLEGEERRLQTRDIDKSEI